MHLNASWRCCLCIKFSHTHSGGQKQQACKWQQSCLIVSTVFNYRTILEQTFTFQDLITKWKITCTWMLVNVKFGVVLITNRGTLSHCLNNQNCESSQESWEWDLVSSDSLTSTVHHLPDVGGGHQIVGSQVICQLASNRHDDCHHQMGQSWHHAHLKDKSRERVCTVCLQNRGEVILLLDYY